MVAQRFTYSLVGTDGVDLGAEHHRGEDEEEEALKAQEYEEDDCCWGGEGTALWWGRRRRRGRWRKRSDRAEEEGSHEELLQLQSQKLEHYRCVHCSPAASSRGRKTLSRFLTDLSNIFFLT